MARYQMQIDCFVCHTPRVCWRGYFVYRGGLGPRDQVYYPGVHWKFHVRSAPRSCGIDVVGMI